MVDKAYAIGLATEITLLRMLRARGNRIAQTAGNNYILTMTTLRNRLLLPEARSPPRL